MRVYVPVTLAMLTDLVETGSLRPVSGTAFAVTPALREAYTHGDDDELAEVALGEAARASLRLLATDRDATAGDDAAGLPTRRAVLVADVPDGTDSTHSTDNTDGTDSTGPGVVVRPDLDDAVVRVGVPVRIGDVVAAYVDTAAAEEAVVAAVAVIDEADLGDEDAELAVGDAEDHDLAWYATQELPFLLDLL